MQQNFSSVSTESWNPIPRPAYVLPLGTATRWRRSTHSATCTASGADRLQHQASPKTGRNRNQSLAIRYGRFTFEKMTPQFYLLGVKRAQLRTGAAPLFESYYATVGNRSTTLNRSPSVVSSMVPFCSSVRLLAMERPSPFPSLFLELSP